MPTLLQLMNSGLLQQNSAFFQIATDFMQGEEYPTLGGISRYITTLIEGLQGSVPPPHWQLQSSWNSLPDAVKRV